ncbi:TcpQ domain-containing protein [Aestuariibacter sp. A3R04]|uniref:TcpQ domain-containing protein n=1 Tax=Aestuariibacter sp. A3R04 TaxID=2841571 RepID=UPI001C0856B9|nr:TcpQ domain-containing protein [Aestuariibacter sp. A3R04]MBU3021733.1 toxin co-regulated pilus biosynthesis Q family protein [Aestuariibacter sp. A3R04]
MAKQTQPDAVFWAKHIGLALALMVIAGIIVAIYEKNASAPVPEGAKEEKSVSQGLSDFYREYRMSSTDPIEEDQSDFVVELSDSGEDLDTQLSNMSSGFMSANNDWEGEHKMRSFKAGDTLREVITRYAQQEGMQVIWDLHQDFVIKYHFQVDNTIVGTLSAIASAIDANFEAHVGTYICPEQRTLVVTDEISPFLKANCKLVN